MNSSGVLERQRHAAGVSSLVQKDVCLHCLRLQLCILYIWSGRDELSWCERKRPPGQTSERKSAFSFSLLLHTQRGRPRQQWNAQIAFQVTENPFSNKQLRYSRSRIYWIIDEACIMKTLHLGFQITSRNAALYYHLRGALMPFDIAPYRRHIFISVRFLCLKNLWPMKFTKIWRLRLWNCDSDIVLMWFLINS